MKEKGTEVAVDGGVSCGDVNGQSSAGEQDEVDGQTNADERAFASVARSYNELTKVISVLVAAGHITQAQVERAAALVRESK